MIFRECFTQWTISWNFGIICLFVLSPNVVYENRYLLCVFLNKYNYRKLDEIRMVANLDETESPISQAKSIKAVNVLSLAETFFLHCHLPHVLWEKWNNSANNYIVWLIIIGARYEEWLSYEWSCKPANVQKEMQTGRIDLDLRDEGLSGPSASENRRMHFSSNIVIGRSYVFLEIWREKWKSVFFLALWVSLNWENALKQD